MLETKNLSKVAMGFLAVAGVSIGSVITSPSSYAAECTTVTGSGGGSVCMTMSSGATVCGKTLTICMP